jgi:hypothetical protein
MVSHLDRKLWRDLRRMKGQAIAVALVMACGLAMMIMARSLIYSLDSTRREYYEAIRWPAGLPPFPAWRLFNPAFHPRSRSISPVWTNRPAATSVRCRITACPN